MRIVVDLTRMLAKVAVEEKGVMGKSVYFLVEAHIKQEGRRCEHSFVPIFC
ncbi:hypothetical protein D3C83_154110 [compost metagenome]